MKRLVASALLLMLAAPASASGQSNAARQQTRAASQKAKKSAAKPEKAAEKPADSAAAAAQQPEAGEAKPAAPVDKRDAKLFEGFGRTPEEEREYEEISDAIRSFEENGREYRRDIQLLIERKFEAKRKDFEATIERKINDVEVSERKERSEAIAKFEDFLRRHPDHARFTPDAMFRLAELYYEKTKDDYQAAMRDYEDALKLHDQGKLAVAPPEPKQSFDKSITLYSKLLAQFPGYKLNDGSLYLLGYCQEKQGEFEQSRDTLQKLIAQYPKSRFVAEAWLRLGEYYFDAVNEPNALDKAADAYTRAIAFTDHPLYDKALYKLGWTYYRMDAFDRAVDAFVQLVDFYDRKAREAGDEEVGGDLRTEALQYMSISLADEKWGSIDRAMALFQRIGPRPWEAELWKRIGDVYSDQTKWPEAVAAYKQMLAKDPLNRNAPIIQDKIVRAWEQGLRDFEKAFAERELLIRNYGPGTPWYEKNQDDKEIIKLAADLSEKSIYSAAVYHHQQALAYAKSGDKVDQAKREFEIAARGYAEYLKRFPHSKLAYELEYYEAECLYASLQFMAAADRYQAVRDSAADTRYQADAAYAVVLSLQKEIDLELKSGALPTRAVLTSKDRPENKAIQKEELPELWKRFVAAADTFLKLQPKHERASQIAYRAAETYYAYDDFEEARRRFAMVAETWPNSEFAKFASNLTLETFLITKDWVAVTNFTDQLTTASKDGTAKVDPNSESGRILRDFGDNAMFKQAEKMMDAKKWDEAGKLYEDLVARNRDYKYADKALNNAAVCRENARRFDSALKIYERIYNEYPKSDLADIALFRVAVNAENSYDFDKAVERYKQLVESYPKSKDRPAALNNLARLLEGLQRYPEAARQFTRFAELFPQDADAPANLYRAATIYEKMNDCPGQVRALNDFIKRFSRDTTQSERVVDAYKRIGDCYRAASNDRAAREAWATATAEYTRRNLSAKEAAASAAAGYARFQLAEVDFAKWDAIALTGRGKALENAFKNKLTEARKLQDTYAEVYQYKSVEWILAASYKKGQVFERFATSLVESPCPPDIKKAYGDEGCDIYRATLVEKVTGLEEKAAEAYQTTAAECLKFKLLDNEWCDRTQESLSRLRSDVRVLKKARAVLVDSTLYPAPLVETPEGPALTKPASTGKLSEGDE